MQQAHAVITAMQNELQDARARQQRAKPNRVKIDTFSNESKEDWLVYKHHFSQGRHLNGLTDDEAKLALAASMRGRAAAAVMDIRPDIQGETFDQFQLQYENRFVPASASQLARTRFEQAQQNKSEDILDFHARLRMLWNKAYPAAQSEELLIRTFSFGLKRKEVREQVVRSNPQNYGAALEAAQNESSVLASCRGEFGNVQTNRGVEPMEIGSINALKQVGKSLAALERQRQGGGAAPKAEAPRTGNCHFCGKPGHWKGQCNLLAKAKKFVGGKPKGRAGGNAGGRAPPPWKKNFNKLRRPGLNKADKRGRIMAILEELADEASLDDLDGEELDDLVAGLEYIDDEEQSADAAQDGACGGQPGETDEEDF